MDGLSPYQIFFGQKIHSKFNHAFSIMSDAVKSEWGLESLRLFASVMRTNGVNPTKEESIYAIQIGDAYFSVNLKVEDNELNDIPIFTQMKDEVLDFSSHALHSHGILKCYWTIYLMQNMMNSCLKTRGKKVEEGSKGVQQQKKKKQKRSKKRDDTTGTNESTSRSSNKRKQRDGSSHISKITQTTQEDDDEDGEESEGKIAEENYNEEEEDEEEGEVSNIENSPGRRCLRQRAAAAQKMTGRSSE
jgi:hypothetical protein